MTLSAVQALAEATSVLKRGGYRPIEPPDVWPTTARVFEDPYGIVALRVYDTWQQLKADWADAQGMLVELISASVGRGEPKAWEGYLVLFALGPMLDSERRELVELRYNTNRVRKLVATSEDLGSLADVQTALLPLLPLQVDEPRDSSGGLLGRLPDLLAERGIDRKLTATAVDAFSRNESAMQRLHQLGGDV